MRIKVLHTNDLHSHFESLARSVSLIKRLKDETTLLVDGGDFADFKSIELRGTKGLAAVELLEYIGYDAITIGNNEMFNGIDTLEIMASHSAVPFISNNLVKIDQTLINNVFSSQIINKKGVRILITGSSPDLGVFNEGLGIHITSFKEALNRELLKNKGKYDVCVLLSHIGTQADRTLAEDIPELDLIISAHDHQLFSEAQIVNGTIINSAGYYGNYVGVVEIDVTESGVRLLHSEVLPTQEEKEDEGVVFLLQKSKEQAIKVLSEPLYKLEQPLWHDVIEENPITNLIADGLRDFLKTSIGLINSGIVNSGAFGELTEKKLIEICPSPLNATAFEIQGKDLRKALESSLDVQVCLEEGRGPGFRGRFVGRLHVSGARIEYRDGRIDRILINDQPLDNEAWYTVGTSDYLQRGSGYSSLASNRNDTYRPEEIRDIIRLYACDPEYIKLANERRWVKV